MAEVNAQERQRIDEVLMKFTVSSSNIPLDTEYNLIHQKYLVGSQSSGEFERKMSVGSMDSKFKEKVTCGAWMGNRKIESYEKVR
jgi:hypothetical protein